ncbi:MAG: hypothetical protein ACI9HK_003272 [Pirellulaceae bacterium]|jgi:hypothetical protein
MSDDISRRRLLKSTVAASLVGQLPIAAFTAPAFAAEARRPSDKVEQLTRFIESTPRGNLIEGVARQVRDGLEYNELLAALLLAGVRNIEPRPAVGFQFHAVLVVHAAHLTSLSSPVEDRWLPVFWTLDNFKSSQATDANKGVDWKMKALDDSDLPGVDGSVKTFKKAMDSWNEGAADLATASLSRSLKPPQLFELFVRYAARDLRSIGHKAIFMANGFRALETIGWEHSESILRSLTYAMLNRSGEPNPSENDLEQDRPWRRNLKLADSIRKEWKEGQQNDAATRELLATMRSGSADDASDHVVKLLNDKVSPQSVFDALFVGAGELLMRQAGIPAIHAVTTMNAVHYLYQNTNDDNTRRMLLLQGAAFIPLFRKFMLSRGAAGEVLIDQLESVAGDWTVNDLLETDNAQQRAGRAIHALGDPQVAKKLIDQIRRRTFLQGRDAHHYKFNAAALEDYGNISPNWRSRFLASSLGYVPSGAENQLVKRIRAALS